MSDYKNGDTASWDASQVRRSQAGHTGRSQGNPSQQPQRRRRKRRRINPVLYILCVLVASAILAGVGWLLASDLCAFSRDIPPPPRSPLRSPRMTTWAASRKSCRTPD